jgi:hypothetical protein
MKKHQTKYRHVQQTHEHLAAPAQRFRSERTVHLSVVDDKVGARRTEATHRSVFPPRVIHGNTDCSCQFVKY